MINEEKLRKWNIFNFFFVCLIRNV
jgi:hypothetical protein